MRCDVVAIGTELLLGQIVDTNSAWIGEQLAASGIDSLLQVKVGDNLGRIVDVLRRTLDAADAVIVCGGLGPTHDDLTREAIAAVMGAELRTDDHLVEVITEMFATRGRRMAANNLRQALVPDGATIIPQTRGTAPGLICPVTIGGVDKVIYAVPGVPHEMRDMVERAVLPDLLARSGEPSVIVSRVLRTWGESESGLNERLDGVIERLDAAGNPTLAFLASGWEGLKVRLTAKADTAAAATTLLDEWDAEVRAIVGEHVFGVDDDTMESVVLDLLAARGWSLGLAESRHRWTRRRADHRGAGRERGVPRLGRQLRQRGQVRRARRARGPGGQRGRGGGDGRGRTASARRRRRPWRSPVSPARPSRTACRSARCASASQRRVARSLAPCACPASATRCDR